MTSYLHSVTPITYVGMPFWPVNASMFNLKGGGGGQRGHVDLRASPQVKTSGEICILLIRILLHSPCSTRSIVSASVASQIRNLEEGSSTPVGIFFTCGKSRRPRDHKMSVRRGGVVYKLPELVSQT